jgi:phage tail-like protein
MMAVQRDRPYGNANFLVDLGDGGDALASAAGFAEVVFPAFVVGAARSADHATRADAGDAAALVVPCAPGSGASERLILKRGVTGALDLYAWWHKARRGKAPQRRTVQVHLLAEDHATVVFTWRFRHARPVSLSYSPLRAMDGGVLFETLELEFDSVELS